MFQGYSLRKLVINDVMMCIHEYSSLGVNPGSGTNESRVSVGHFQKELNTPALIVFAMLI